MPLTYDLNKIKFVKIQDHYIIEAMSAINQKS